MSRATTAPVLPAADKDEMRKRILGAAFQAFTARGYAGTTTRDIAAAAKVSKRDLYAHFESKQAMLFACIESRTVRMRAAQGLPEARSPGALESTLTAFATQLLTEACHPAVIAMFRLAVAEADRSPEVGLALQDTRRANRRTLADFIGRAQSDGLLRSGDADEMAGQCLALVWEDLMLKLLLGVIKRPGPTQIQRNAAKAVAAFLHLHQASAR